MNAYSEDLRRKKHPGSKPKLDENARRLLEADLEERPAATLLQWCELLDRVAGEKVSESTVSRMLKRMRWSRKKDQWVRARRMAEGSLAGDGRRKGQGRTARVLR